MSGTARGLSATNGKSLKQEPEKRKGAFWQNPGAIPPWGYRHAGKRKSKDRPVQETRFTIAPATVTTAPISRPIIKRKGAKSIAWR
jgi:hypothetical protein